MLHSRRAQHFDLNANTMHDQPQAGGPRLNLNARVNAVCTRPCPGWQPGTDCISAWPWVGEAPEGERGGWLRMCHSLSVPHYITSRIEARGKGNNFASPWPCFESCVGGTRDDCKTAAISVTVDRERVNIPSFIKINFRRQAKWTLS